MDRTNKNIAFAILITMLLLLVGYFISADIIEENPITFITLYLTILLIVFIVIYFYLKRKKKYLLELHNRIYEEIKKFEPSQKYKDEIGYHAELQGWLKRQFPETKAEVYTQGSRTDIVIKDIAIEVKGPTGKEAMNTLANKYLRYTHHFKYLIVVLFDLRVSDGYYKDFKESLEEKLDNLIIKKK